MPRRLGQHFLRSRAVLERIAAAACGPEEPLVIEIGPGKGALTEHLLARSKHVVAIEVDQVLVPYLQQRFRDQSLTVLHADVLKTDLTAWGHASVAGNLPYYITSPIVERVLAMGPLLRNATFLVQKEVAIRMTATPGTRDYGYLTVQVRLLSEPKLLFEVPPGAFAPPPKVDSAVVQLTTRSEPLTQDHQGFLSFAAAAFRQKRKTLRNNLADEFGKPAIEAQPEAGLRAEQLSIQELVDLHQRILKFR